MSSANSPALASGYSGWQQELQILFGTPLEKHRRTIEAAYLPLDDVLAGRCPVVLYPAARMASTAAQWLLARGVDVRGFSDRSEKKWGQKMHGLPIVHPAQIASLASGGAVLVASTLFDSVIREYLAQIGCTRVYPMPYLHYRFAEAFPSSGYFQATEAPFREGARDAILQALDLLADDASLAVFVSKIRYYLTLDKRLLDSIRSTRTIYFDTDILALKPGEVVIDGGAFNGDTLQQFLAAAQGQFDTYYAFEPDPGAFEKLRTVAAPHLQKIECVRAGLSDRTGTLRFTVTGAADSTVTEAGGEGTESLPVVDLDSYFKGRQPPTLIKMDIEGSERAALAGARGLISKHHPRLAVSAYHYPKDLWEIPLLLAELNPGSPIYLRHYTREIDDTVCYSLPADGQSP